MALTESYMLPFKTQAPLFQITNVFENKDKSLNNSKVKRYFNSFYV